jgi:hypothetical protein
MRGAEDLKARKIDLVHPFQVKGKTDRFILRLQEDILEAGCILDGQFSLQHQHPGIIRSLKRKPHPSILL